MLFVRTDRGWCFIENKGTQRFCKKTNNFINVLDEDMQEHTKNGWCEMSCTYRVPAHRAKYDFVFDLFQYFVLRKSISLKHCSPVQQSCPSLVVLERTIVGRHLGLFQPTSIVQGFEELSWQLFPNRHSND